MPYRETTVFCKRNTGRPLCFYSMVQNIILPKIAFGPGTQKMPYRETTVFWKRHTGRPLCFDSMIQNIILPQIAFGPGTPKNAIPGDHCVLESPYRETTVF